MTTEIAKNENSAGAAILRLAQDPNTDPNKLKVLLEVRQAWEADEARKQFAIDFAAFQAECPIIKKADPGAKAKYAKIDRIWRETRPLRKKYGLSVVWSETNISDDKSLCRMRGMIVHRAGHTQPIAMDMPIPGDIIAKSTGASVVNVAERFGMAITYCQRRGECAVLGIVTGEDDDGNCGAGTTPLASESAIKDLRDALKASGKNEKDACEYYGVASLVELTTAQVRDAMNTINKPKQKPAAPESQEPDTVCLVVGEMRKQNSKTKDADGNPEWTRYYFSDGNTQYSTFDEKLAVALREQVGNTVTLRVQRTAKGINILGIESESQVNPDDAFVNGQ